jgi:hypothetical protein
MSEQQQALVPVEQKDIGFYGDTLTAVLTEDGTVYVPVRPICDYLGIAWNAQYERMKRDTVLSEVMMSVRVTRTDIVPESRQPRTSQVIALPIDFINGFLFGINASRVKEEVRENLVRYQRECYRVLADAFLTNVTVRPLDADDQVLAQLHNMALVIAATTKEMMETKHLALDNQRRLDLAREYLQRMNARLGGIEERLHLFERRIQAGSLTEEQAREIQHRVNSIAEALTRHDPGTKHHPGVYEALRQESGATSYKAIPLKGYTAAIAFLDNWLQAIEESNS